MAVSRSDAKVMPNATARHRSGMDEGPRIACAMGPFEGKIVDAFDPRLNAR